MYHLLVLFFTLSLVLSCPFFVENLNLFLFPYQSQRKVVVVVVIVMKKR